MSEQPAIQIKKDYESPPNITGVVPGEQTIRQMAAPDTDTNTSTSTEVTDTNDTEYTLSPVITVTKKETTLTKGDLKLQKITVSEDISMEEMENGQHSISYTESETSVHTSSQHTVSRTVTSSEVIEGTSEREERRRKERKSKIPKLKFRQTVEKVKQERREQKLKDESQKPPRRSSIPKLKDAKLVKKQSSISNEPKPEDNLAEVEAQILDEFDKIYEEIVDDPQKDIDIDDKVLAIKIDDPEKVETKFEEIIHAYDSNDDSYFTPSGRIKLSKIPWRRKDDGGYRSGSLADRMKRSHSEVDTKIKDGGFKVSATTITTKRFSRGNSADLSNTQRVDIVELKSSPNGSDKDFVQEYIVTETIEDIPIKTNVISRGLKREISLDSGDDNKTVKKIEKSKGNTEETVKIEEFEGGRKTTKETITRQNIKTGIPIKHENVNRSISKELNRRPPSLDDRDFVNREVIKHESLKNDGSKTIIRETIVKETPVKSEKVTRGISRTFSRDGKSITVSPKTKEYVIETSKMVTDEDTVIGNKQIDTGKVEYRKDIKDEKPEIKKEDLKSEKKLNESSKKGIPVITKTTHSYSKGHIQNVEISKTIEWKPADEIRRKSYNRSFSENKKEVTDKKFGPTVIKKEAVIETKLLKENVPVVEEFKVSPSDERTQSQEIQYIKESLDVSKDVTNIQHKADTHSNNLRATPAEVNTEESVEKVNVITPIFKEPADNLPEKKDSNIPPVTILKGNVNRLISQISVKESQDVKKEIDIEEDLPKKKSVLSKIAMFEGKEPAEFTIKVKKCVIDKKPLSSVPKENIDEAPKIVDQVLKTQPKLGPSNDINIIETNVADKVVKEIKDEPVVVDQIWKSQDQSMESISIIHHIEDVRILPAAIESTVSKYEIAQILPGKLEQDKHIKEDQNATTLPGKIDFSGSSQDDPVKTLPGKLTIPENMYFEDTKIPPVTPVNTPIPEDVLPNAGQNDVDIKYSPEKVENISKEKETDIKNRKVGKLDLNFWQKQVDDNKKFIGAGKPTKIQTHLETQKVLHGSIVFEKLPNETKILPPKIEIKPENNTEIPTLPAGKIYLTRDVSPSESVRPAFATNDRQLQVPEILPETPLTKSVKKDFETQQSHIDVPVIYPDKIEFTPKVHTIESPIILPEIINFKIDDNATKNAQTLPGKIDISMEETHNISHQILPGKIDFNISDEPDKEPRIEPGKIDITVNDTKFETAKILPGRIDFKPNENKVEISRPLPGRINLNLYENRIKPKHLNDNTSKDAITVSDGFSNKMKDDKDADDVDREVPSDPELVDSEPEIKESKEPIMSKLKNKIFYIANKSKNKDRPADPLPIPVDTIQNELNTETNKVDNNDSDMGSLDYITKDYKDSGAKSDVEFDKTDKQREDIKRAKSLAELDLGDVVKGQVQRMVYRIKSVDIEKAEAPRARKISVKEMPRKSYVLEKIALFEGKSTSRWEKTERPGRFETTTNRLETRALKTETRIFETATAMPVSISQTSLNQNGPTAEEVYLQRVEDLVTAKLRYGKSNMLYLQLSNVEQMPAIALGTALMDKQLAPNIVAAAIDLGFRAIDTAFIYDTEQVVGEGIRMKLNDGTVKREELFIMSKLWSTFHRQDLVEPACRASLKALGLDYFDLFMIHNPMSLKEEGEPIPTIASVLQYSEHDYLEAWFGMEKLVSLGLVKNIGVSNFNSKQIQRILDKGKIKPIVNQVECHPYLSQQRLQNFCTDRNITLSCFGVLGSKGTPQAFKNSTEAAIDDPMIKVMASGLNKTPAQLLVRYQIQSGRNAVVKASTAAHLWDVLQALTFTLQQHEIDAIHALSKGRRTFTFKGMGETHPNYPFNEPY